MPDSVQGVVNPDSDGLASQLELSPDEVLTLHALQCQMMRTDLGRERKDRVRVRKSEILERFHAEFVAAIASEPRFSGASGELVDEHAGVAGLSDPGAAERLARRIDKRSRGIILLIELMTFNPWYPEHKWVVDARKEALKTAVGELAGISEDDYAAATKEFDALSKQLRRKSIRWGRIAAVTVVGAGLGVATAGWAAPFIGSAIGAAMGLSGAAATSAGLAAIGGGSIASGGFGIFGGTILVSGVGGVFGAGAAGAAGRYSPVGTGQVVSDAIKLDLLARLVLADAPDRDQKLRRVAEGLQSRINDFSETINSLSERIVELKADLAKVTEENRKHSKENSELKEELATLKESRADAKNALSTLEVVRDRLPERVA